MDEYGIIRNENFGSMVFCNNDPLGMDPSPLGDSFPYVTASGIDNASLFVVEPNSTAFNEYDDHLISSVYAINDDARILDIGSRIINFEQKYKMDSKIFSKKWYKGELADEADFYNWSNLVKRYEYAKNR